MSRRRKQAITAAARVAAAVLQHSQDEAARALAQFVLDLQPWPAPRALRRRARTQLRHLKARLNDLAEIATAVTTIATELVGTAEQVDALLKRAAATQAAVQEEERRISQQRAVLAGWGLPGEPRA